MAQQGRVVAVTGASGYIGTKLLERLEQEPSIRKLVAFDVAPLPLPVHNIAVYRKSVSEPIEDELNDQSATTLVHLAFNARRGANRREVAEIHEENLQTLRSVMASCVSSRVTHLIYLSSHLVYGAHSDNPIPIPDDAEMRPSHDFPYAHDKHHCELALEEFARAQNDIKITVLRSCIVLGNGADNLTTQTFFHPWMFGVAPYDPPLQFVYDDDLARVISIIIQQEISGTFNVAGDGVVRLPGDGQDNQEQVNQSATFPGLSAGPNLPGITPAAGSFKRYSGPGPLAHLDEHRKAPQSHRIPVLAHRFGVSNRVHQLRVPFPRTFIKTLFPSKGPTRCMLETYDPADPTYH